MTDERVRLIDLYQILFDQLNTLEIHKLNPGYADNLFRVMTEEDKICGCVIDPDVLHTLQVSTHSYRQKLEKCECEEGKPYRKHRKLMNEVEYKK